MVVHSVLSGLVRAMEIRTPDQELEKGFGSQVKGYWTLGKDYTAADVVGPSPLPELPEPARQSSEGHFLNP